MGSRGAYSTPAYKLAKKQLAGQPCWMCGRPAFTVDHVPALSTAPHWRLWRGELRPACAHCNYTHGNELRRGRKTNPSRAW